MRYGLKERLLGALVLLALAVIVLPWILEEERVAPPVAEKLALPPAPQPLLVEVDLPEPPELPPVLSDPEQARVQEQNQEPETPSVTSAMRLSLDAGVEAWAIQVASFGEQANARRLVERLLASGFHAYWRNINQMAVVFTGPYIDQQQAREDQDQLLQQKGMKTLLTRYVPEKVARDRGSLPD